MTSLAHSPAADRNKQPILEVLRTLLPPRATVLEIASGTGQHAVWFAQAMPGWTWHPTEADAALLPTIAERAQLAGTANVLAPMPLDVLSGSWPGADRPFAQRFDAIFCANLLHIAPWPTCAALMRGAARHLAPSGVLVTYGPYLEEGAVTAPGNVAFDQDLRARDAAWGLRRLQDVAGEAQRAGLALQQRHAMPANNLLLVFGAASTR